MEIATVRTDAIVHKMTFFGCMALLVRLHHSSLGGAENSHLRESSVLIWVVLE
jgi:hypothetical protein